MTLYRVRWDIEVEASSPRQAASAALAIQRDPKSISTVFDVAVHEVRPPDHWTRIDLGEQDAPYLTVAVYEFKHGTDVRVFETAARAEEWRQQIATDYWDELDGFEPSIERPEDPGERADVYFRVKGELGTSGEFWSTYQSELHFK